ncbi:hypothetical protein [Schaalia hyovaginalis]|uniref:hypothetical protein n=1 Tax=Schaalia hyovaginalis TaxID=29316 RepID=UPI0026ECA193|nr:hypothetical protein [Schaalia hyovaginalis]MCI6557338.1 hypothetical protein [Schaalia hyovaginalis]MDY3094213.1 hypothetical protein [Schaalia hyovaginalis]MDY3664726.1 hypothetical protein [Schaalia hyovaginalis]
MDVLALVHALGRAEWGPLAGGEMRGARLVLDALASIMWDQHRGRSATTLATARQIADRAAYSERWTRISLHRLEDVGLVQWQRGGVIDGNPQPGRFRIVKSVLCDWIEAARRRHDERMRRYIEETRRRLRALIYKTVRPRLRSSDQAEASTSLPPYRGRKGATGPAHSAPKSHSPQPQPTKEAPAVASPLPIFMPTTCTHGNETPRYCNVCRSIGWTNQFEWDKRQQEEANQSDTRADAAVSAYLDTTYPHATGPERARLALADPKARALANA